MRMGFFDVFCKNNQIDKDIFDFHPKKYLERKEYLRPILPKANMKRALYEMINTPNKQEKERLVYSKEEIDQIRREMEANGELRRIFSLSG